MDKTMAPARNANDESMSNPDPGRTGTVENVASYVGQKAEDATSYVGHKAEEAASYVGHKAEDAASYAGQKAGDASAAVGSGLRSFGHTIRDRRPEGGMTGDASAAVADTLESGGRYLQEEGLKVMTEDVANLIRRNPIPALLIGVAAGYLAGKAMTRRS
jgi:hypothetical protein